MANRPSMSDRDQSLRHALEHIIARLYPLDDAIRHEGVSRAARLQAYDLFSEAADEITKALHFIGDELMVEAAFAFDA